MATKNTPYLSNQPECITNTHLPSGDCLRIKSTDVLLYCIVPVQLVTWTDYAMFPAKWDVKLYSLPHSLSDCT